MLAALLPAVCPARRREPSPLSSQLASSACCPAQDQDRSTARRVLKALPSSLAGHLFASLLLPPSVNVSPLLPQVRGRQGPSRAWLLPWLRPSPAALHPCGCSLQGGLLLVRCARATACLLRSTKCRCGCGYSCGGLCPSAGQFRPADWRQIARSDTCGLTRSVSRSGSCSACADCSINFTQLTVYALGKRPVAIMVEKEFAEQCTRPLAWLLPPHSHLCAAGPLVGRATGSVARPGTVTV